MYICIYELSELFNEMHRLFKCIGRLIYRAEKRRIEIPGQSDVSGSLKCRECFDPEPALPVLPAIGL